MGVLTLKADMMLGDPPEGASRGR